MKQNLIFALLFLFTVSLQAEQITLTGSIGNRWPISMKLSISGSSCTGTYRYTSKGVPLYLEGELKSGVWQIREHIRENDTAVNGIFTASITETKLTGTWRGKSGEYPVSAQIANAASASVPVSTKSTAMNMISLCRSYDVNGETNLDIVTADIRTGTFKTITKDGGTVSALSPDHRFIAFGGSVEVNFAGIVIRDLQGILPDRTIPLSGDVESMRWSPDGKKIAFEQIVRTAPINSGNFHIFTVDTSGKNLRQITQTYDNHEPSWSPDSRKLVYAKTLSPNTELFIADLTTGISRKLTPGNGKEYLASPAWAPDGKSILYSNNYRFCRITPEGKFLGYLNTKCQGWESVLSPDGKQIAYRGHDDYVHVMNADGSGDRVIKPKNEEWETANYYHPSW